MTVLALLPAAGGAARSTSASNDPLLGTPQCPSKDPAYLADPAPYDLGHLSEILCANPHPGTRIAVVEYGVDPTPQDAASLVTGYNSSDGSTNTVENNTGFREHGTHTASIIHIVCPSCVIIPCKIGEYVPGGASYETEAACIRKMVEMGAQVINISLGYPCGQTSASSELDGAIQYAIASHVIPVMGAGNCGSSDPSGDIGAFDNRNATRVCGYDVKTLMLNAGSNHGQLADICAPMQLYADGSDGQPVLVAGTSFAAPQVSGMIGNMPALSQGVTVDQVKACLTSTADSIKAPPAGPALRINDYGAVTACGWHPPTGTLTFSKTGHGTLSDSVLGLSCSTGGTDCSGDMYSGTADQLTESPDPGWKFAGWGALPLHAVSAPHARSRSAGPKP